MLANNDWRYKYTAVMALSQIGEYIEDVEKVRSVLQVIVNFLKHPNPMKRERWDCAGFNEIGRLTQGFNKVKEMDGKHQITALMLSTSNQ